MRLKALQGFFDLFFDFFHFLGCGIFDRWRNPKPSAASFAAMRTFIPGKYEYIGTANLGPNHMVQIVRADGKVVALAYKIKKDGPDLEIKDAKAELVTDMFGRELKASNSRKLDIAPTWYVGLDEDSDWLKQCPIDFCFESPFFVRNVSDFEMPTECREHGDWQRVYKQGCDSKYGTIMVSHSMRAWRLPTFDEFYGGAIID